MGVRPAHYQKSAHGWKAELGNSAQNIVATIPTKLNRFTIPCYLAIISLIGLFNALFCCHV
jgi:hypothetical protein